MGFRRMRAPRNVPPMKFACMTVVTLTRCLSLIALLSAPMRVLALDAAPSAEQANAAYRRALEVELRKEAAKASPSPLVATLLESMKLAAVQGCRALDAERSACIVELDSPMRAGYEALRFRRDGADWQVLAEPDTPPRSRISPRPRRWSASIWASCPYGNRTRTARRNTGHSRPASPSHRWRRAGSIATAAPWSATRSCTRPARAGDRNRSGSNSGA